MMTAPTVVGPLDQVKTRVTTFLAVGRQGDKRNIAFLRTSWRTEKDPAVRAVIADSLYQSDPQDYLGARTLLDSFTAGADVYGRLRKVSAELQVEVPGFSSVVELAAGGSTDALTRMLELSRAAAGDPAAEAELAEAFGEVARTAPDELSAGDARGRRTRPGAGDAPAGDGAGEGRRRRAPVLARAAQGDGGARPRGRRLRQGDRRLLSQRIAEEKAPKATAALVEPKSPAPVDKPPAADRPGG